MTFVEREMMEGGGPTGGGHGTARDPKRAHLKVQDEKTPPIFHEDPLREERKIKNCGVRGKKKARNLGRSGGGGRKSEKREKL